MAHIATADDHVLVRDALACAMVQAEHRVTRRAPALTGVSRLASCSR